MIHAIGGFERWQTLIRGFLAVVASAVERKWHTYDSQGQLIPKQVIALHDAIEEKRVADALALIPSVPANSRGVFPYTRRNI